MTNSLYGKLASVLLGLLFLIGILFILLTLFTTRRYLQEVNQKLNRDLAKNLVAGKNLMQHGQVDKKAADKLFTSLMDINPNIEIYLVDPEGNILAFSAPPEKIKRTKVTLAPLTNFLDEAATLPILGDDPRDPSRQKVFSVYPMVIDGVMEGYLYVVIGGEEYDSVAERLHGSYILQLSTWAALAGLLVALLTGLLLFRLLTQRLRKLAATMEMFALSNFTEKLNYADNAKNQDGDEIDQLSDAFHRMADRLGQQMQELQQTDTLRRELVANVSHDLRTPLASLQGYLETLLMKEGKLSLEEQRHLLEVATKHSHRLGKLVSELFELAKLDSQETQPHKEPFLLAELIQDVVLEFQLVAEQKHIRLRTDFREDLPFVLADIGLIERVLENLLENALRYTPQGGTVTVALASVENTMSVQVSDSGRGIPEKDLPYIFDRFYRVEKRRGERSGSAGLGLAIAKRILDLHGSRLQVQSMVNVGTTFTFQLPLAARDATARSVD